MPNYIQYSTSNPSGSLKKGNAALGITNEVTGPTSTTGWYSGINPQSGSYVVYEVAASGDPDIYCPQNATELLNLVKSKGATGGNTGSVAAALAWISTQPNLLAVNEIYPNIITNSDVLNLDAQFVGSYPTTGSTWYDVSGTNNNGTLTNGPIFNSLGVISFDNVDDYVQISSSLDLNALAATRNMTICFTAKKLFYGTGGNNTGDSMVLIGANNGYDSGFRITENNLGTPGTAFAGTPAYGFGAPPLTNGIGVTSPRTGQNTFSYVAFSQSGSSVIGFINGKFNTATFSNAYTPGANNGAIGRDPGFGVGWFGGYIGNFQIYNRALSQAEILQNYYQAPIVTDGLVLALDAGNIVSYESSSASTYSMTGSLSGSLFNGTSYNGGNGGSWVFDGIDDYINVNAFADILSKVSYTKIAWFYLNAYGYNIISGGSASPTLGLHAFWMAGTNKLSAGHDNLWQTIVSTTSLSLNTWYFGAVSFNTTTGWKLYVNGILEATNSSTSSFSGTGGILLGAFNAAQNLFNGRIASAQVYNRVLSDNEILQNFNAQKTRFGL